MTSNRFIYIILAVFIAGNLLLISMQYNSAKNIEDLTNGNGKLLYELKVDNRLRELERDMLSVEGKIRGSIALNDISYLEGVDSQIAEAKNYLQSLKEISGDSTVASIGQLYEIADEKLNLKNLILDSFNHTHNLNSGSFKTILERRILSNEVNNVSRKVYNSRQRILSNLSLSISSSARKARMWGNVMILLVLTSEAVLFWYIISRIRRQNDLIHQLDASEKKVREVSLIKENFMANMSHEIRTPMNAILGFTNLLKSKNKDPHLTELIEPIRKAGENLVSIIDDILDLSKIEAGMMRIESVPFSLRAVIHSIRVLFTEKINERGLELLIIVEDSIPDVLTGDSMRLTQVLVNMIGNAIKFTPAGTIHLEVHDNGLAENRITLGFAVSDTGIGILKDKLPGIFERFSQAEDSVTRKYGGTGLGLSIVKELVLLQKGTISATSEPGKGTTFSFTIPYEIAKVQLPVILPAETEESMHGDAHHIHILVVEDNEMNQNLVKHLLNEWNFSFDTVNNGLEAIARLGTTKYDLVLMDIQMPVMDGYTAAHRIRTKLKLDIPIIAMTAHAFPGERDKCLGYGMNEYIAKPINEKALLGFIMQFTGVTDRPLVLKEGVTADNATGRYNIISLQYMRDISMGNMEYERTVTRQFIEAIPQDIDALESAMAAGDTDILRKTAHSMKTNVSVMGLTEILGPLLDSVEYEPFDELLFQRTIILIKTTCINALQEARHFYATLD